MTVIGLHNMKACVKTDGQHLILGKAKLLQNSLAQLRTLQPGSHIVRLFLLTLLLPQTRYPNQLKITVGALRSRSLELCGVGLGWEELWVEEIVHRIRMRM